ncbi:uncharacterized protein DUF1934 [Mycoplasma testudineum]|uniref:Uncharacterized protein DUF1934 n=2 Tax=Mycoplasma testudineum TaxID=244584 RepID=A0A4R6ICT6_9MOLU|nr:uncharacterized protein DUF1934 [Mycoplasma testudineum]
MKVNFRSKFRQNNNDFKIEFVAPVLQLSEYEGSQVVEFIEPEKKVLNRFEFYPEKIIIISGPSTLELEKDSMLENIYQTPQGKFPVITNLKNYNIGENNFAFEYDLLTVNGDSLGEFNIEISLK